MIIVLSISSVKRDSRSPSWALYTVALIFILMIVADFSTFAIYVMRFVCPCA